MGGGVGVDDDRRASVASVMSMMDDQDFLVMSQESNASSQGVAD